MKASKLSQHSCLLLQLPEMVPLRICLCQHLISESSVAMQRFHMKPSVLENAGIKVHKVVQNPGDFIVTFAGELAALTCYP